jgi:hypothetical protein
MDKIILRTLHGMKRSATFKSEMYVPRHLELLMRAWSLLQTVSARIAERHLHIPCSKLHERIQNMRAIPLFSMIILTGYLFRVSVEFNITEDSEILTS